MTKTDRSADSTPLILIVDDVRENRELLEAILGPEGYRLSMAQDGATALATVAYEHPDLVISDVMMPGLTGYDVVTQLRADPATCLIPVLICSSLEDVNSHHHAMSVGADDVLTKPVRRSEVVPRVKEWLEKGMQRRGRTS